MAWTEQVGYAGAVELYLDRLNDDYSSSGGYELLQNITGFSIGNESDVQTNTSRDYENFGATLDVLVTGKGSQLKFSVNRVQPSVLAMALFGTDTTYSVGAGSFTDQAVTAKLGKWVPVGPQNLTSGTVVVTDSTGTTTYAENTDYLIDYRVGMLKALSGGAISDAEALLVDGDKAARSGTSVAGGTNPIIRLALVAKGRNRVDGRYMTTTIAKAMVKPDGQIDWAGTDWVNVAFSGEILLPSGASAAYTVEFDD